VIQVFIESIRHEVALECSMSQIHITITIYEIIVLTV